MMKVWVKYVVYAGVLLLIFFLGVYFATMDIKSMRVFFDSWALGSVLVGLFLVAVAGGGLRIMSDAFFDAWSAETDIAFLGRYRRSRGFFLLMGNASLYLSGALVLGAIIILLFNPSDKAFIGQWASFGLLSLMYCLLLRAFFFQPLALAVERKVIALEGGNDA